MSLLQAIILGAVQGLTEFVPISSSGHLVLVPEALSWPRPGLAFDVLLHSASLLALVAYFASDLREVVVGTLRHDRAQRNMVGLLLIGTIPAGLAGLLLGDYFERSFEDPPAAAIQLVVTAILLVAAELLLAFHIRRSARSTVPLRGIDNLTPVDAAVIGVAQAVSILPGISRSGATIGAGLALAVKRDDAARFAFLLAIPALLGASVVSIPDVGRLGLGLGAAVGGFASSLVTSYLAIAGLIRYLRSRSLYPFAAYCVVAGVAFYLIV